MFDREENNKTGLRQWQHIQEPETYAIDVHSISHGTLEWTSYMEESRRVRGETLDGMLRGETHMGDMGGDIFEGRVIPIL